MSYPRNWTPRYPHRNGMATTSLVTGIIGMLCVPIIASVIAVVTGHIALGQMKTQPATNRGNAIAGLVMGYIVLGVAALGLATSLLLVANGASTHHPSPVVTPTCVTATYPHSLPAC